MFNKKRRIAELEERNQRIGNQLRADSEAFRGLVKLFPEILKFRFASNDRGWDIDAIREAVGDKEIRDRIREVLKEHEREDYRAVMEEYIRRLTD